MPNVLAERCRARGPQDAQGRECPPDSQQQLRDHHAELARERRTERGVSDRAPRSSPSATRWRSPGTKRQPAP